MDLNPEKYARKYEDSTFDKMLGEGEIQKIISKNFKKNGEPEESSDLEALLSECLQHVLDAIDTYKDMHKEVLNIEKTTEGAIVHPDAGTRVAADLESAIVQLERAFKCMADIPELMIIAYHSGIVSGGMGKLERLEFENNEFRQAQAEMKDADLENMEPSERAKVWLKGKNPFTDKMEKL